MTDTHQLIGRSKHGVQGNDSEMYWEKCKEITQSLHNSSSVFNSITGCWNVFLLSRQTWYNCQSFKCDKIRVRQKLLIAFHYSCCSVLHILTWNYIYQNQCDQHLGSQFSEVLLSYLFNSSSTLTFSFVIPVKFQRGPEANTCMH